MKLITRALLLTGLFYSSVFPCFSADKEKKFGDYRDNFTKTELAKPVKLTGKDKAKLKIEWYSPAPYTPEEQAQNRTFEEYIKKNPNIKIEPWSSLRVQGSASKSGKLMSVAGGMAPDIWRMWFHEVLKYSEQGFVMPLNKYIGYDENGDGRITGKEVKYKPWNDIPEQFKMGCVKDGKIFALPYELGFLQAICYRRDLFKKSGLDPDKPPVNWDELWKYAQILTYKPNEKPGIKKGQYGIYFINHGHTTFNPLVWMAGGDLVHRYKKNPKTGKIIEAPKEKLINVDPETGDDLRNVPERWKTAFNTPEGLKAMQFLHKLRWQKWAKCPDTGKPFDLTKEMLDKKEAVSPYTGKKFKLTNEGPAGNIYVGVLYVLPPGNDENQWEEFAKGRVAMFFTYTREIGKVVSQYGVSPEQLGIGPPPAAEKGGPIIANYQPVMFGISEDKKRDMVTEAVAWDILKDFTSEKNLHERIRILVEAGKGKFVYPEFLKQAGYQELFESLPISWQKIDKSIDFKRTEPYNTGWTEVQMEVTPRIVDKIIKNKDVDLKALLAESERLADDKMQKWPEEVLAKYRPIAWIAWAIMMALFLMAMGVVIKSLNKKVETQIKGKKGGTLSPEKKKFRIRWIYIWLLPALLSILLWRYYPLIRGSFMAFQDYKIAGDVTWVGIDNFIQIAGNPAFYWTLLKTFYYVGLTILIGFTAPIFLAILLTEIPFGKYFFRTVFYLPAVTSALVIMFLWKQFYDPSPAGLLNSLVIKVASWFGVATNGFKWLGDARFAMICIVIPGVWAAAGAGSLIYQAALQSISTDLYEAADVDGAGLIGKIRHITIPTLKPLIIINFVGVFIGSFHAMQNIFVMTGGGPDNATRVIGMDIWFNAFMYLKFGMATAMAWILGVLLIGFTVMQLKILSKVEFRRAQEN